MTEHAVGNQVVLCGTIVAIEGDIALVQVDKSFPAGGTVAVRLGKLPEPPDAREVGEMVAARIRRFRLY